MIQKFECDYRQSYYDALAWIGIEVTEEGQERIAKLVGDAVVQVTNVLQNGLDIGTIGKHIVPVVELFKHDTYGWVFRAKVSQRKTMLYKVTDHIRHEVQS